MNCDCISKLEKTLLAKFKEKSPYKKPVERVTFQGITFVTTGTTMTLRSCTVIEIELDGQKKLEYSNMLHKFCPFCGVEQEKTS